VNCAKLIVIICVALAGFIILPAHAQDEQEEFNRGFWEESVDIVREQQGRRPLYRDKTMKEEQEEYNEEFWKASVNHAREQQGKAPLYRD